MEILNRYPVYKQSPLFPIILFLTIIAIIGAACVTIIWYYRKCELVTLLISMLVAACLIGILSVIPRELVTSKYRYEVYIKDDNFLNDILDKYRIVDHKNMIYILEDK